MFPDQGRPHDDSTNRSHPVAARAAPAFTAPTFERFVLLALAAILTPGRRTVANLLRTVGALAPGHRTSYQRVLSSARWSGLRLACCLCRLVLRLLPADRPGVLVGDDTVDGHKGKRVWGKARHRDPVRSTRAYTAWRYGHRWVVLAVLVHFPFTKRPWALPSWPTCTAARTTTAARADGTARRRSSCAGWWPCCCAGSPTAASCWSATPATARTRSPASAAATAPG